MSGKTKSIVSARPAMQSKTQKRPGVLVLLNKDQCAAIGVEAGDRVSIETHGDALVVKLHEKKPRT